jgi:hypothetical protein
VSIPPKFRRLLEPTFPKVVFTLALALSFTMVRFRYEAKQVKKLAPLQGSVAKLPVPAPAPAPLLAQVQSAEVPVVQPAPVVVAPPALPNSFATLEKVAKHEMRVQSLAALEKIAAASIPKTSKKVAHKKILRPRLNKQVAKQIAKPIAIPEPTEEWYEARWTETWEATDVVDTTAPLDVLVATSLQEPALIENTSYDPMLASVQLGLLDYALLNPTHEERLNVIEGDIAQNDFGDLKEKFHALNTAPELEEKVIAPKAIAPPVEVVTTQEPKKVLDASKELSGISSVKEETGQARASAPQAEEVESKEEALPEPEPETARASPAIIQPEPEIPTITEVAKHSALDPKAFAPLQAGVNIASLTTQISAPAVSQMTIQPAAQTEKAEAKIEKKEVDSKSLKGRGIASADLDQNEDSPADDGKEPAREEPRDSGVIYGKLYWDSAVESWLTKNKAHIELRLERYKSKNPQDTIFLTEYEFPNRDFKVDGKALRGNYQLIAALYTPKETGNVAQVTYSKLITAENYKENIVFKIAEKELQKALSRPEQWTSHNITLTATVFEGASGNPRQPKVIPGAAVTVIGHPEIGTLRANEEGNIRIPHVPARSELLLEVHNIGFYSARFVVPVFESNVYVPLYLIERDKVETITKYFTKREQAPSRGLVFGRIFDTDTRSPKKSEQVWLSFRKGHALYFDALPSTNLKETTDTGMFAFFNIEPSFRTLFRDKKPGYLMNVRPSFAQYVEIGRGGKKAFKGRLFDPFANIGIAGKVRFVGGDGQEVIADESGNFEFAEIDLPPGVLTLEIQAEGYPTTWHTVPWNIREPQKRHSLFLLEKDLVAESQSRVARVTHEKGKGLIVGGADPAFFGKKNGCISVSLEDTDNKVVSSEKGPFVLTGKPKSGGFCLTARRPGFAFYNLPSGEYILKWKNSKGSNLRSHVVRVGTDRVSVVVN